MKYYVNDPNYLSHHGVAGQKWGVRNAEWYPIANWEAHMNRIGGSIKSAASTAGRIVKKAGSSVASAGKAVKAYHDKKVKEKADNIAKKKQEAHDNAIKNNDVKYIRENKKDFTNDEINKAIERHSTEGRLDSSTKDIARTKNIADAIQKGDIKYALAHKDKLSSDEINEVIARYNTNTKLKQLVDAQTPTTRQKVDEMIKNVETAAKVAESGTKLWNAVVPITNAMTGANLPKIGEKEKSGIQSITEMYKNGELVSKQIKSIEKGIAKTRTDQYEKKEEKKPDNTENKPAENKQAENKQTESKSSKQESMPFENLHGKAGKTSNDVSQMGKDIQARFKYVTGKDVNDMTSADYELYSQIAKDFIKKNT